MSNRSTLVDPLKLVGQVFDERYTVESVIGRGGMGVVYKAEHTGSSQTVALKVLYRQFAEREHQLKRFSLELKACSKLHHRNTERVLDYGRSTTGYLFIAMEYLKGETLAEMLRHEKTVPRRRILRICSQISSWKINFIFMEDRLIFMEDGNCFMGGKNNPFDQI